MLKQNMKIILEIYFKINIHTYLELSYFKILYIFLNVIILFQFQKLTKLQYSSKPCRPCWQSRVPCHWSVRWWGYRPPASGGSRTAWRSERGMCLPSRLTPMTRPASAPTPVRLPTAWGRHTPAAGYMWWAEAAGRDRLDPQTGK